ncbi:hypothetical protein JRO89_XS03G0055900 [Xanthoceras sorbifolium]|uniref:PGG domain-containing protein n=1 Tax=Xanthoceras sorbifolium TaxID=99658 RepID=A0ABQ8I8R7_9ROSI|nr:hypothetical protein JRO89_XS03G0055900 [Xanthoceras sorbifolium]
MEEVNPLFDAVMRKQWDAVLEACAKNPNILEDKLTKSEDTALHIAASDGETAVVSHLVEKLGANASNILEIKNEIGNTALHLAASRGNVDICHCIASKHPSVVASRNNESETPLFLAALHGKKEAFLCLNHFSQKKDTSSCRKRNGDTILHAAISGEFFSVAFQIIQYYPALLNSVNENGLTPLHVLASKPNAFQSSSRLKPFDRIIYHCMFVNELKKEKYDPQAYPYNSGSKTGLNYPQNYDICMTFFRLMERAIGVITKPQSESEDEENPQQKSSKPEGEAITGASSSALESKKGKGQSKKGIAENHLCPPNYTTFVLFLKLTMKALLIILGVGISRINKITDKKARHTWAYQIMNELVDSASLYKYEDNGHNPSKSRSNKEHPIEVPETLPTTDDTHHSANTSTTRQDINDNGISQIEAEYPRLEKEKAQQSWRKETPLLIAAKMGVAEMVEKILDKFPVAVQDLNIENKNLVLLAVENRQTRVYQVLLNRKIFGESAFRQLDNQGNSALHLAATFGEYRPWLIPGAALQMQWEIKWYKFVKESMPRHFFVRNNNKGETPKEIFTNTHKNLVKEGREWLTKTSESCSVVAALIATVAYATSATVPGGVDQESGKPVLENAITFNIFAISSLVALCFSVTALVFFLAILTSRYQEDDFSMDLPRKLLLGLTSLFTSIGSILISFCSGHFLILKNELRAVAYPIYVVTCLPMTFFAIAQLPLYFDLIWAIFKKVPQRSYKVISH